MGLDVLDWEDERDGFGSRIWVSVMSSAATIHIPLYGSVHVDGLARKVLDTPALQRLRRIQQLQVASIVYPSAVHTRFEHVVGAYHLAKKAVRRLAQDGELADIDAEEAELVVLAALLHDAGHGVASHSLEEIGLAEADHERAGERWIVDGEVGEILDRCGIPDAARRIAKIIRHEGNNPLRGIVAGACDVDKIDYIARDAHHCDLPLGFNRDDLINAYTIVRDPASGAPVVGLKESGLPAFEQLLYSKFNLYRSVYFHRTVRAATVMMRAMVILALESGLLEMEELRQWTDQEVFILLRSRIGRRRRDPSRREMVSRLIEGILYRKLYRPVVFFPLSSAPHLSAEALLEVESYLAARLGLEAGEVLLDIPRRPTMLSTDILVRRHSGEVVNARDLGPDDGFALNLAAEGFYLSSGRWSLYAARPVDVPADALERLVLDATSAASRVGT